MKVPGGRLSSEYRVAAHGSVDLSKIATRGTDHFPTEKEALKDTAAQVALLGKLQQVLAADRGKALLIVLQAMDAGGKDGTIRHIFTGVNPQGCDVAQFKVPTPLEASHDFLWRVHKRVPAKGMIVIFNRSHYEDVLITRVHDAISHKEAERRYEDILGFERELSENGTVILKFFLHISHKEQTARLQARIDDKDKRWKLSESDFHERKFWPKYQKVYSQAIEATSRKHAPWFVIPSDDKWYRNAVISRILVETLQGMDLKYPKPSLDFSKFSLK
jgi:PPK2 family polyphosphate:nucleotide phosphotransferase